MGRFPFVKSSWILSSLGAGLLSTIGTTAIASTLEMRPHVTLDSSPNSCPAKVIAYQTPRPYQEGGYSTDGMVQLQAIATQIEIAQVDAYSVTWVGTLKAPFAACKATAGITAIDSTPYTEHSYLRLRFQNGKVYFILDMTGLRDANSYTPVILNRELRQGNPRWRWGGTD